MEKKNGIFWVGALIVIAASFVAGMLVTEWRQLENAEITISHASLLQERPPNSEHEAKMRSSNPTTKGHQEGGVTIVTSPQGFPPDNQSQKVEEVAEEVPPTEPQIAIPMALSHPETFTNLSLDQRAVVAGIADDFVEAVRASGAYPQTDAYKKTWEEAASNADEALRIRLGVEAYQKMGNGR